MAFRPAFACPAPVSLRSVPPRLTPRRGVCTQMTTAFRKYHGLGNDFILIDNRDSSTPKLSPTQSAQLCNRHTGVGADGVIFLLPALSSVTDAQMRLYNADGSEPEMCGNGIRCLARFAADLGMPFQDGRLKVDTGAGVIVPELIGEMVRVDMGVPVLESTLIPTSLKGGQLDSISVNGEEWKVVPVSMGNPHCITFMDDVSQIDKQLEQLGPLFEHHETFPQRTNTEFVKLETDKSLTMIVWERGSGRTMACGTGACAVLVAAVLTGRAQKDTPTIVHLPGGDLQIEWRSDTNHVLMTGPAQLVFSGTLANLVDVSV